MMIWKVAERVIVRALDQPHLIFYRAMQAGLWSNYSTAQAQQIEV